MEEIKNKIDILEIVQKYVKLKKVGKYYTGFCPFHKETKPSFYVSPEKQIFKCFGCSVGGDSLKFLMKIENLSYRQALERLKDEYGLETSNNQKQSQQEKEILEINYAALKFFKQNLKQNKEVEKYLKERGLTQKTIDDFDLGFSPGNTLLRDYLYSIGFSLEKIKKVGLLDNKNFDRFQSRIIFPLRDEKGRLVGFTGRLFQKEYGPKYLNSPETQVFKKSQFLYGFFLSKDYILQMKSVYLTEGQFDFLLAWQNNLKNIVCLSGSALTEGHLQKLKKYCSKIIFALDNDEAGFSATLRANLLAKTMGFQTFKAIYSGKDLAEFFLKKSRDEEIKEIKFEDYLLNYLLEKYSEENKNKILEIFLPQLKVLPPLAIDEYLDKISSLLKISKNLLEQALEKVENVNLILKSKDIFEEGELIDNFSLKLISLIYLDKTTIDINEIKKLLAPEFNDLLSRLLENKLTEREKDYFEMAKSFFSEFRLSLKRETWKTFVYLKKLVLKDNLKNLQERLKFAKNEESNKIILEINSILKELKKLEK